MRYLPGFLAVSPEELLRGGSGRLSRMQAPDPGVGIWDGWGLWSGLETIRGSPSSPRSPLGSGFWVPGGARAVPCGVAWWLRGAGAAWLLQQSATACATRPFRSSGCPGAGLLLAPPRPAARSPAPFREHRGCFIFRARQELCDVSLG